MLKDVFFFSGDAMPSPTYAINPGWQPLLVDMGASPSRVLRRAGLPEDLFAQAPSRVSADAYHALWLSVAEEELAEPAPICLARALSAEVFDPPMFAALCSENLQHAAERIADFKPLIGPMKLLVEPGEGFLRIRTVWPADVIPPAQLGVAEVLFWVALARMGTRRTIIPIHVGFAEPPSPVQPYASYLGTTPTVDVGWSVTFSGEDARRVFLTANDGMWRIFEPELRKRLADFDRRASTSERVRAVLLKHLPSGRSSMAGVARELGLSTRTLQRRLLKEETSFQVLLATTRESLARHYLRETEYGAAEISYLLGYDNPNSFYRAFQAWTNQTPECFRLAGLS
ncbi:MAG: AraC family transcriptional regulator ligand-binding domain-containing protein [Myxococcota bacterium]